MKCIDCCLSCLCGNRNRVSPSEPIQIIQANAKKHHSQQVHASSSPAPLENGGARADGRGSGRINPNFMVGDDERTSTGGEGMRWNTNASDNTSTSSSVKALFIEVGKDRLMRVIHIRSSEDTVLGTSSRKSSLKPSSPLGSAGQGEDNEENVEKSSEEQSTPAESAGGDDEEDEYWFSKWARKPRFRSIFAKNSNSRPRISENNNNSVDSNGSPEEAGKISAELEMARAAAAAKRRAWAYNNNGSRESITQHPTVNANEEEEFSSIAIVSSNKQQWTKGSSNNSNSPPKELSSPESATSAASTVQVEVSVERRNSNEGISNPAFQEDDEEEGEGNTDKTENEQDSRNDKHHPPTSGSSSISTASIKSRLSSNSEEDENAIIADPNEEGGGADSKSKGSASPSKSRASFSQSSPTTPVQEDVDATATPKKPILFFIHSISCSSDVWHHQLEFFQQLGYEIVAPDLLGHGLSSTPLNPKYYFFESLVQDLILIFDHFTKEENSKVVLIGHGYGACLAAFLTRIRLKNVCLLISIAGGGPTPLVRRLCCEDSLFAWKCKLFHSNRIRGRFDNPELQHVLPPSIHESILSGQVWGDGDSAFYRRVTVPTLLVYGMRDKVVTLVEECEMERTIPKSFLELIDTAGHMVMMEEPEKLNKMLCKFIQSWS